MSDFASPDTERRLTELKLRALAEFAAGAGHEINNPVATIVGYSQQLLAAETDPDRRHALATIGAQAYRIRDMIGDIMLFARPPALHPREIELSEVVREIAGKYLEDSRRASVRLQVQAGSGIPIFADPVQLRIVLSSLLRNSLEAVAPGGLIVAGARLDPRSVRPHAVVSICDDGPGFSERDREHMFDPFYSGRQAGRGLGFGLAKVWRIVRLHGGTIAVDSPDAGGVTFTVRWPAHADGAETIASGPS